MENTSYEINPLKREARLTFLDNGTERSYYALEDSIVTLSSTQGGAIPSLEIIPIGSISAWWNLVGTYRMKMAVRTGIIRDGFKSEISVAGVEISGEFEANGEEVLGLTWNVSTNTGTASSRDEMGLTVIEFEQHIHFIKDFIHVARGT